VREKYYKKYLAINQPREDLELRNSYSMLSTVQVRYVYGTSLVLKQKPGLEFEWEYSAFLEDYMYVYYTCARYVVSCTQCTVRWPGAGAGGYSTNAVEYGTAI
jgi:hypothetical protein